jgi:hypothetical protein
VPALAAISSTFDLSANLNSRNASFVAEVGEAYTPLIKDLSKRM